MANHSDVKWRPIDLRISETLRDRFQTYLSSLPYDTPTIALLWGSEDGAQENWSYAAYDSAQKENLEAVMRETGQHFFYLADGVQLIVLQPDRLSEVEERELTIVDGKLTVC